MPTREVLKAIDVKIAEIARKLQRLQEARLRRHAELRALQAARAVIAGRPPSSGATTSPADDALAARRQLFPDSVFTRATRVLEEAGQPLHVTALKTQLDAHGRRVDTATLVGALARAVKRGWLRRFAPNVYGLARPRVGSQPPGITRPRQTPEPTAPGRLHGRAARRRRR